MRLLVYSHDTFGLGNIKRMLAICTHLHVSIPGLSILIVSGSPMLHSFRVSPGIDYIKLPCLKRSDSGDLGVRFLDLEVAEVVRLRRELILSTVVSFRPDVVLVDKKPEGLANELEPSLRYIRCSLPQTRTILVLRDILDTPASTIRTWSDRGSYKTVEWYYDDVFVLGTCQIFDVCAEYEFPASIRDKVRFCGYVSRPAPSRSRQEIRRQLGVNDSDNFVLVTTGGGEDGFHVLAASIAAIRAIPQQHQVKALIVAGPELAPQRAQEIRQAAQSCFGTDVVEFIDDMMSYMNAADTVVSMAGYNTICELLTLGKRAIIIPRVAPVEEQKIRAERMATLSVFHTILPGDLEPAALGRAIVDQLMRPRDGDSYCTGIDLGALPRIGELLGGVENNGMGYPKVNAYRLQGIESLTCA